MLRCHSQCLRASSSPVAVVLSVAAVTAALSVAVAVYPSAPLVLQPVAETANPVLHARNFLSMHCLATDAAVAAAALATTMASA